tara:strand:- start:53 stop:1108 length:1056 start_codon:yes stop_codon:yes gene_type:complete
MKRLLTLLMILCFGCMELDDTYDYEQRLSVWAHLQSNMPLVDTIFVSRTAKIDEIISSDSLWVSDAVVKITGDTLDMLLEPVTGNPGRYFTESSYIFRPGIEYTVTVNYNNLSAIGKTTIPSDIIIETVEPSIYTCRGVGYDVPSINIENFSNSSPLPTGVIDTVFLRQGDCFTESFASYPLYKINFNEDDYQTIRIISLALEAEQKDLEPFSDLNSNNILDINEEFEDWNENGVRDSIYSNLIYDTTGTYSRWKGPYLRDKNNIPYKLNPWPWNIETSPVNMSWLFYDYYGYHLMTFQATDEAFFDYFQGLPEFNTFVLPTSNVEGGYGLVSSSASKSFLVYVAPYNKEE